MDADFLVLGALDGSLRALAAHDGAPRWTRETGHPFGGPALVRVGDSVVAAALDGYVCALALDDGALRWETTIPEVEQDADPMGGKRVVTNGAVVVVEHGPKCTGHDPADGHIVWRSGAFPDGVPAPRGRWLLGVGVEYAYILQMEYPAAPPPPTSTAPTAPTASTASSTASTTPGPPLGRVLPRFGTTALSTWDGTPQWFLEDRESPRGPAWDGAPSLVEADGVVYTYGQELRAVEAAIHHPPRWAWEYLPENPIGGGGGMLAVGGAAVVVANEDYLGAFRRDTGTPLWAERGARREGYFEVFSGLTTLGEVVYVGRGLSTPGFRIEARAAATGEARWAWPEDPTILRFDDAWRFCGAGDTLYVPSANHLWGVRAADGAQLWHRELPTNFGAFLAIAGAEV
jgi:outer membrane protein assembly factor BamB